MLKSNYSAIPTQTFIRIFIFYRYRVIASGLGFALFTFFILYFLTTPQWEARGTVKLGHVPILVAAELKVDVAPVAPALDVVESLKQSLYTQGIFTGGAYKFNSQLDSPRVRLLPSGNLEIKVMAPSREQVAQYLSAMLENLKLDHEALYKAHILIIEDELRRIERQLVSNRLIQDRSKALLDQALKNKPSLPDLLLLNILTQQMERIDRFSDYSIRLKNSLNPLFVFPTNLSGKIEVSNGPVSPNRLLHTILSLFVGMFAALTFVLILYLREMVLGLGTKD